MRKALLFFGLMVAAQWLVPLWNIVGSERVLTQGRPFLFRTAPVDPYDWFRGEYVQLGYAMEQEDLVQDAGAPFEDGEEVFVLLTERNGEAAIERVQRGQAKGWAWLPGRNMSS